VSVAIKILLMIVVFGPIVVWGVILIRTAIADGRDAQKRKRVTRG
jgi:hypothetical protein